jgi:Uma2 family endonuclease
MTMATATIKPTREADGDQCVALRDVGWKGYSTLLRLRGERYVPRIVYLDGTAWLMSPSFPHERLAERLGQFVTELVVGLDIPFIPAGSMTFRRGSKRGGVEGDKTYYLANEERVRGKDEIDLKFDPPPDLAIEAVHSHDADAAVEVYRRFKVPEVWVCDEAELVILVLERNGRYAQSPTSASFPFLRAAEVYDWVSRPTTGNETDWIKSLRPWVLRTLKPRVRRPERHDD